MSKSTREAADPLVRWADAAAEIGVSVVTLEAWYAEGIVPLRRTPGLRLTWRSWLDAVLAASEPGTDGDIAKVTAAWWAARRPRPHGEVAA
jgi:hypothetical protein